MPIPRELAPSDAALDELPAAFEALRDPEQCQGLVEFP